MGVILLVEDDKTLNKGIKIALEKDGHKVTAVFGYLEALSAIMNARVTKETFDLWLLDVVLPDGNGYTLCCQSGDIPVMFITANDTEEDYLNGFKAGCDDYIAKPFSLEVLRQKVIVMMRRTGTKESEQIFEYNDLRVNFDARTVTVRGVVCRLTATEYKLLEYMAMNRGRVLTREMLLSNVWDSDDCRYVDDNTLSVQIKRLRKKIELDYEKPEYIITVFGMGYAFGK